MRTCARRAISLGVLFPATLANTLCAPLLIAVLAVCDALTDRRMPLTRAYLLIFFYLVWETAGVAAAFAAWLCAGVWPLRNRRRFLAWNYALQRIWAGGFAKAGIALFSLRLAIDGGYAFGDKPFLMLVRHTSLADTILVSWCMLVERRMRMRYAMKKDLLWDPCLDIVGNRLPNCFLERGSRDGAREVEKLAALATGLGPGEGVVMYPEGTRFSKKKRAQALKRLKERGDAALLDIAARLRHVLPPRPAGTLALLEHAPQADAVFFVHDGFEGASSFADMFRGSMIGREIRARYWTVPASLIPASAEARRQWLYEEWMRVDETVDGWRKQDGRLS